MYYVVSLFNLRDTMYWKPLVAQCDWFLANVNHRRRQGNALGARASAGRIFFWAKFTGESCKCTPGQRVHSPRGRARVHFFMDLGRCGRWGVEEVIQVVLACVLRATTKKSRQLFGGRQVHPQTKSWLRLWRELTFTFAICRCPSVCRLVVI